MAKTEDNFTYFSSFSFSTFSLSLFLCKFRIQTKYNSFECIVCFNAASVMDGNDLISYASNQDELSWFTHWTLSRTRFLIIKKEVSLLILIFGLETICQCASKLPNNYLLGVIPYTLLSNVHHKNFHIYTG